MSDSLFQFEFHPGDEIVLRFRPKNLIPDGTHGHLKTAQREMLLALRDMLDKAIEKTEPKPAEKKKPKKIEVQ